jgi:SAM-dependent methyltransferase
MNTSASTYDARCFERLAPIEDRHFWFVSRARAITAAVRAVAAELPAGYRIVEVGCGNGTLLRTLAEACPQGHVVGMDLFAEGLHWARLRSGSPLVRGDVLRAPFAGAVNIAGMFDVLEHLDDDIGALKAVRGMLAPAGSLVLTVPAHPALWSYFDEYSHHRRRYTAADLESKLTAAGYRLTYLSEYMCLLLPLLWLSRKLTAIAGSRKGHSSSELAEADLKVVPVLNEILKAALAWETRWIGERSRLPFGASIIAVATPA